MKQCFFFLFFFFLPLTKTDYFRFEIANCFAFSYSKGFFRFQSSLLYQIKMKAAFADEAGNIKSNTNRVC